jgi:hypothetical protein
MKAPILTPEDIVAFARSENTRYAGARALRGLLAADADEADTRYRFLTNDERRAFTALLDELQ